MTTVATRKAHQVNEDNAQPKLGLSDGDFSHSHTGFAFSLVIPIHVILHPRHRSGVTRHTAAEHARARLLIQPPHVERLETRQRHESRAHTRTRSQRVCINHHAAVRRDRMEAISLSGHAPMVSTPTPDPGHKTRLPHPHTITCQPRSGAQRRSTPRMAASTHALHPPAHVSAHLQQYECTTTVTARSPVTPPPARVTAICTAQPIPLTSHWPPKAEPAQIRKRKRHTASVSSSQ